jgi:hypothetical protein
VPMSLPSIQPFSPQWEKSNMTSPPNLNQFFWHFAPNCISLQITLPLPHLHILKVTIPLIPIPCRTITFNLCLPRVDVTKFDGLDPTGWVTQMEHYFSLYNIIDDLAKLPYGVLHLDQERWQWWQWWQWRKNSHQGYIAWTQFVVELYECFDTDTNHLGCLTKMK